MQNQPDFAIEAMVIPDDAIAIQITPEPSTR